MSLEISVSARAGLDLTLQYQWSATNAGAGIAERWLQAVHETICQIAPHPGPGVQRHFASPELVRMRRIQVRPPFHRHLLFQREGDKLSVERLMHGAGDLPRRLLEDPDQPA